MFSKFINGEFDGIDFISFITAFDGSDLISFTGICINFTETVTTNDPTGIHTTGTST